MDGNHSITMSRTGSAEVCGICKCGSITRRTQELTFHQITDKGRLVCRVTIPMGICDHCGTTSWDGAAEALIEDAVRREYEKLPERLSSDR
jgi:hypothetical protein